MKCLFQILKTRSYGTPTLTLAFLRSCIIFLGFLNFTLTVCKTKIFLPYTTELNVNCLRFAKKGIVKKLFHWGGYTS